MRTYTGTPSTVPGLNLHVDTALTAAASNPLFDNNQTENRRIYFGFHVGDNG